MKTSDPRLIDPISETQPCGPDLSYDPKLDALEIILKGQPEVEIGSVQKPAEPPDWVELREKSKEFLAQSKHLRVATMLCCSALKTEGLPGFRDALRLIKEWLEKYWPTVYPLLDVEDNNDPTQRLNILGVLTANRGSVSGWLTIVDNLYAAEIFRPKGLPPVTFDQVLTANTPTAEVPDLAKLATSIPDAGKICEAHEQVLAECLETAHQIDQFLTNTLGSGNTISFEILDRTLKALKGSLKSFLPGTAAQAEVGAEPEAQQEAASGGPISGISVQGLIRSREDVVRVLESVCNYYKQVEPGSPVPFLLRRAQKLAKMDFIQAMQELNLATVEALRPSMGSAVDGSAASIPAAPAE